MLPLTRFTFVTKAVVPVTAKSSTLTSNTFSLNTTSNSSIFVFVGAAVGDCLVNETTSGEVLSSKYVSRVAGWVAGRALPAKSTMSCPPANSTPTSPSTEARFPPETVRSKVRASTASIAVMAAEVPISAKSSAVTKATSSSNVARKTSTSSLVGLSSGDCLSSDTNVGGVVSITSSFAVKSVPALPVASTA